MTSEEYRQQLTIKLRTLMAVLNVAVAKIQEASEQPGANVERLGKVLDNLENTHSICQRALKTLEEGQVPRVKKPSPSGAREYTEFESIDEYKKFQGMPPISAEEVANVDLDDLLGQL